MMAQQAKQERDEFLRVIQKQKEQEDEERQLEQQRHGAFRAHAQTIRQVKRHDMICDMPGTGGAC